MPITFYAGKWTMPPPWLARPGGVGRFSDGPFRIQAGGVAIPLAVVRPARGTHGLPFVKTPTAVVIVQARGRAVKRSGRRERASRGRPGRVAAGWQHASGIERHHSSCTSNRGGCHASKLCRKLRSSPMGTARRNTRRGRMRCARLRALRLERNYMVSTGQPGNRASEREMAKEPA
jgi:hypothetical protein